MEDKRVGMEVLLEIKCYFFMLSLLTRIEVLKLGSLDSSWPMIRSLGLHKINDIKLLIMSYSFDIHMGTFLAVKQIYLTKEPTIILMTFKG